MPDSAAVACAGAIEKPYVGRIDGKGGLQVKKLIVTAESQINALIKHSNRRGYKIDHVEIRQSDNVVFVHIGNYAYITLPSIMDMPVSDINLIIN